MIRFPHSSPLNFKTGSLLLLVFLLNSFLAQAQLIKPPKWAYTLEPKTLEVGQTASLIMEAEIPLGWYVYSNDFDKDLGPLLTEFKSETSADFAEAGKLKAINPKKKFDEVWEGDVAYFMGKGRFEQPLVLNKTAGTIKATLEYQMCSDLTGQCINYEEDIELSFTANPAKAAPQEPESVATEKAESSTFTLTETEEANDTVDSVLDTITNEVSEQMVG